VKLLMAVKQRWPGVGGDYVNFNLPPRRNHHHVLEHTRDWLLDEARDLESVPVEVHRMCVGALVIEDQAVTPAGTHR